MTRPRHGLGCPACGHLEPGPVPGHACGVCGCYPAEAACSGEFHGEWDGLLIDLYCERESGHPNGHSAGEGEWAW